MTPAVSTVTGALAPVTATVAPVLSSTTGALAPVTSAAGSVLSTATGTVTPVTGALAPVVSSVTGTVAPVTGALAPTLTGVTGTLAPVTVSLAPVLSSVTPSVGGGGPGDRMADPGADFGDRDAQPRDRAALAPVAGGGALAPVTSSLWLRWNDTRSAPVTAALAPVTSPLNPVTGAGWPRPPGPRDGDRPP